MSLKFFFSNIIPSKGCMCLKWLYLWNWTVCCISNLFLYSIWWWKMFYKKKTVKYPKILCSALWWSIKWMVNKQPNTKLNEYFKQKVFVWSLYIVKQHAKKQKSRKCLRIVLCVHCTLMIINENDKATQANTKFRYVFCYKNIYDLIEYIYLHSFWQQRERERQSSENHLGF